MKKFISNELTEIRNNLNNGMVYCGICNSKGIGRIYHTTQGNIGYQHCGSSAVKNTNRDLKWLLETIFSACEDISIAEWSDYHINYIPMDKRYIGIDMSMKHPNVCGL